MVAIVLLGGIAYELLPVAALPNVAFPTISVTAQLPGADPQTMASSVATPLEKQFGQIPVPDADDVDQLDWLHADHAAVRAERRHQCRGTAGADGDQRGGRPTAEEHADAADLSRDQSGGRADPGAWADLGYRCRSPRWTTTPRASWRRSCRRCRASGSSASAAATPGDSHSVQSGAARGEWPRSLEDVRNALTNVSVDQPKGSLYGQTRTYTCRPTIRSLAGGLGQPDHRLSQRRTDQGADVGKAIVGPQDADAEGWVNLSIAASFSRSSGCRAPT